MNAEFLAMILYFVVVICIGVYFFLKSRGAESGEKDYFLGGRQMNGWVAALSAGASDMSAWVLMGLPGSIYLYGVGQVWIAVGLAIGTILSWTFVAPNLRRYSIRANDSITIPQFLTNRFLTKNKGLQIVSAIVFVVAYCVYSASSISACGTLFNTVLGVEKSTAMIVATIIILLYVFLGGFNAVCWTDFFQGMLMLAALMLAPIFAVFAMKAPDFLAPAMNLPENYYNLLSGGGFNWKSLSDILSGFGWGLGYFGMPHIIVRYISIRSEHEMRKSQVIGSTWTTLILAMAAVVALVGRKFLGDSLTDQSLVFVNIVRAVFPTFIAGVLLSAILAAAMSTADSQLLASSSAFASDIYKAIFRKDASDKEMLWAGRAAVVAISVVAYLIAVNPNSGGIMDLVSNAWGFFGAAFGPVILLALYWRRLNYTGAVAGVVVGFVVDFLWFKFLAGSTGLYEIIPGFVCGLIAAVVVSLVTKAPSKEVTDLFDAYRAPTD